MLLVLIHSVPPYIGHFDKEIVFPFFPAQSFAIKCLLFTHIMAEYKILICNKSQNPAIFIIYVLVYR